MRSFNLIKSANFIRKLSNQVKILLCWGFLFLPLILQAEENQVKIYFFYSQGCKECEYVKKKVLSPLVEEYGQSLAVRHFDIGNPSGYELLVRVEEAFKDFDNEQTPFIAIDGVVLSGKDEAEERLSLLIKEALKKGGTPWPLEMEEVKQETRLDPEEKPAVKLPLMRILPSRTETKPDTEKRPAFAPPVYLAYLYATGCPKCNRVNQRLSYLEKNYPSLQIKRFNIDESTNKELAEGLGEIYGIEERLRLSTPAIFIGEKALIKDQITDRALDALLKEYVKTGTKNKPWEEAEKIREKARENIINRVKSFGILPIIFAGLVDSINPCAFATLLFLIAYLAFVGQKGKVLLLTGGAFTFGVFLTYLLIGLGFLKFLTEIAIIKSVARYIYILTGILTFVFGWVNLYNYFQAKKGEVSKMKLHLPIFLRKKIMATINLKIKENQKGAIFGAFSAGVVVSLLELACTGQVYLPTIVFVASLEEGMVRFRALAYLLLYNLIFIIPLVAVFVFTYFGTRAKILTNIMHRYLATVELITASFFFLLGGLILYVAFY